MVREDALRRSHRRLLAVVDLAVAVGIVPEELLRPVQCQRRAADNPPPVVRHAVDKAVEFAREVQSPLHAHADRLVEIAAHSARDVRKHGVRLPRPSPVVEHEPRQHLAHRRHVEVRGILRVDHVAGVAAHLVGRVLADVLPRLRVPLGRAVRPVQLDDEQAVASSLVPPRRQRPRAHHRRRVVCSRLLRVEASEPELDLPRRGEPVHVVSVRIGDEYPPGRIDGEIARPEANDVEEPSNLARGQTVLQRERAYRPRRVVRLIERVEHFAADRHGARASHRKKTEIRSVRSGEQGDSVDEVRVAHDLAHVPARSLLLRDASVLRERNDAPAVRTLPRDDVCNASLRLVHAAPVFRVLPAERLPVRSQNEVRRIVPAHAPYRCAVGRHAESASRSAGAVRLYEGDRILLLGSIEPDERVGVSVLHVLETERAVPILDRRHVEQR